MPVAAGVGAWGLVTGVAMIQSGLPMWAALAMSLLVYAGSAQLAALPLLLAGEPVWVVTLTALIVNLRFVIYSAAMRPYLAALPLGRRLLLGSLVADIPTAVYLQRAQRLQSAHSETDMDYWIGVSAGNFFLWHVSSVIGIFAATAFPRDWGLELAGSLALLALLVPTCKSRPGLTGCLVAALVAVVGRGWPLRLGILCGTLTGIAAAYTMGRRS